MSVYLDHAATTFMDEPVLEAMMPFLTSIQGNANALYGGGREAFRSLEDARKTLSDCLGASRPDEIVFTGGGTEADDAAIIGIATAARGNAKGGHVVTTAIEHHAVKEPVARLHALGFETSMVKPDERGIVTVEAVEHAMREDTTLVSVMQVNNEVGTVQPVTEICDMVHGHGALFHTDAVQALGKLPLDLETSGVDAASFSAHKIKGPKGAGALYLRRKTPFAPYLLGGGQEGGRRSGTQNVAGAVGFARALELTRSPYRGAEQKIRELRQRLLNGISECARIHPVIDYDEIPSVPSIVGLLVTGAESETLVCVLDAAGFEVGAGSACSVGSLEPSEVLLSMGISRDKAFGFLRVSFGIDTTPEQIDDFARTLVGLVEKS